MPSNNNNINNSGNSSNTNRNNNYNRKNRNYNKKNKLVKNNYLTSCKIHRCRFVNHVPSGISTLAFSRPFTYSTSADSDSNHSDSLSSFNPSTSNSINNKNNKKSSSTAAGLTKRSLLACARANGDIEIWNPIHWHCERTFPGIPGNMIEALVWLPAPENIPSDNNEDEDEDDDDEAAKIRLEKKETPKSSTPTPSTHKGHPRLLSAGLDGFITEWDFTTLAPKAQVDCGGGSVWCMAASPSGNQVAVSCEDGCVRLFNVLPEGGFEFKATLDRQDSRILSVAYHPRLPLLSTGSTDSCIRTYSTQTLRSVSRATVDTAAKRVETLIWCLKYLPDGKTLASGDSTGSVVLWDVHQTSGELTLRTANKSHAADVLCLTVSDPDDTDGYMGKKPTNSSSSTCSSSSSHGGTVFSSGMDRKIVMHVLEDVSQNTHQKIQTPRSKQTAGHHPSHFRWIVAQEKRYHSHDVRALALSTVRPFDTLVSGGIDGSLTVAYGMKEHFVLDDASNSMTPVGWRLWRTPTFPERTLVDVAKDARLVVARDSSDGKVRIWQLGASYMPPAVVKVDDERDLLAYRQGGHRLEVRTPDRFIAEIKIKHTTNLTATAISRDGTMIAVSDLYGTRLFHLTTKSTTSTSLTSSNTKLRRIKLLPPPLPSDTVLSDDVLPGATSLRFTPDSARLVLARAQNSGLAVYDVSKAKVDPKRGVVELVKVFLEHQGGAKRVGRDDDEDEDEDEDNGDEEEAGENGGGKGGNGDGDVFMDRRMKKSTPGQSLAERKFARRLGHEVVDLIAVSPDGQWLASGDLARRIHVFNLDALKHHATLPRLGALHTAMNFHPASPSILMVASAANDFILYDVEDRRLTDWSGEYSHRLPHMFVNRRETIMGVEGSLVRPEKILIWSSNYLCTIDLSKPVGPRDASITIMGKRKRAEEIRKVKQAQKAASSSTTPNNKANSNNKVTPKKHQLQPQTSTSSSGKRKHTTPREEDNVIVIDSSDSEEEDDDDDIEDEVEFDVGAASGAASLSTADMQQTSFSLVHNYGPTMYFGFVKPQEGEEALVEEAVCVERPLLSVLEALPPSYYKKRYGS